jgi:hypothetical protein
MSEDSKTLPIYLDEELEPEKKTLSRVTKSTWNLLEQKSKTSVQQILESGADDYDSINLTEIEEANLVKILKKMSTGAATFSPMRCAGAACPFAQDCPLVQMKSLTPHGKAPVGKSCILEETMMKESIMNYLTEYEVDPNNFTELGICTELAEIEILQWRLTMSLRRPENAQLVIEQAIGIDRQSGDAIVQLQVSPLFEQKQKLATRKSKLIKLMVGDRQEKYKKEAALKQKVDNDPSSQMSSLKKQLEHMQHQIREKNKEDIIEGEILSPEDIINGKGE